MSQNPEIANSDIFNGFLLSGQQASMKTSAEDVSLDVFLMNGHKISVGIVSTDQTDAVLEVGDKLVRLSFNPLNATSINMHRVPMLTELWH